MKKLLVLLAVVLGVSALTLPSRAQASRCLGVQPICRPGTHPVCLCESDLNLRCGWVCASPGFHDAH